MRSILIFLAGLLLLCPSSLAQDSAIQNALKTHTSIVSIRSIEFNIYNLSLKDVKRVANRENYGAGVILDQNGIIVTNYHTIQNADKIEITLHDQSQVNAKIVHLMPQDDLALLKISPPSRLQPIPFADCTKIRVRQPVMHIGHSYILNNTISAGMITGLATHKKTKELTLIRINMNLYAGDSGGPVLNGAGQLTGMMMGKHSLKDRTAFAVSANKIKKIYMNYLN